MVKVTKNRLILHDFYNLTQEVQRPLTENAELGFRDLCVTYNRPNETDITQCQLYVNPTFLPELMKHAMNLSCLKMKKKKKREREKQNVTI